MAIRRLSAVILLLIPLPLFGQESSFELPPIEDLVWHAHYEIRSGDAVAGWRRILVYEVATDDGPALQVRDEWEAVEPRTGRRSSGRLDAIADASGAPIRLHAGVVRRAEATTIRLARLAGATLDDPERLVLQFSGPKDSLKLVPLDRVDFVPECLVGRALAARDLLREGASGELRVFGWDAKEPLTTVRVEARRTGPFRYDDAGNPRELADLAEGRCVQVARSPRLFVLERRGRRDPFDLTKVFTPAGVLPPDETVITKDDREEIVQAPAVADLEARRTEIVNRLRSSLEGVICLRDEQDRPVRIGARLLGSRVEAETTVRVAVPRSCALIGGATVDEGQEIPGAPGLTLREVRPDGIVVDFQGETLDVRLYP